MDANENAISDVLAETKRYEIPPYQRPYSWNTENVSQFLEDIWEAFENNENEYFIGSLIAIKNTNSGHFEVVDGQQRLATIIMTFCGVSASISNENATVMLKNWVSYKKGLRDENVKPKLTLREGDQNFFIKYIIDSETLTDEQWLTIQNTLDSPKIRLYKNFITVKEFLANKIELSDEENVIDFAEYIWKNVMIVFVTTGSFESAFRMFNVLNTRGMSLSHSDIIKNNFFAKLSEPNDSESKKSVENRWIELEKIVGIENLDIFLAHYLTTLNPKTSKISIHKEFQSILNKEDCNPSILLDKLIETAQYYQQIVEENLGDDNLNILIKSLHRVAFDGWLPPVLAFLIHKPVVMKLPEFVNLIEKITYQFWIRRCSPTERFRLYHNLIREIKKKSTYGEIIQLFKEFENNIELQKKISENVYGRPFLKPVLFRIEDECQDNSVQKNYMGRITVEHVLPQELDGDWLQNFTEEEHENLVHCLGNLVLLSGSKNSKAQNFDFERKKKIYNERMNKVSFDTTQKILAIEKWTPEEIRNRRDKLVNKVMSLWEINISGTDSEDHLNKNLTR